MHLSRSLKGLLAAAAVSAISTGGAMAADLTPIMATPVTTVPAPAPSFNWGGAYVGAGGGASWCVTYIYCWGLASVEAGYNFVNGNFLVGIEGQAGAWLSGGFGGWMLVANARAGHIAGNVLVYGEAGVGTYLQPAGDGLLINGGGGVEVGVAPQISLFGEVKAEWVLVHNYVDVRTEVGVHWHIGH